MKWYDTIDSSCDVVISSRVRLARNLDGFAFPHRLAPESSKRVALCVKQALETGFGGELEFTEIRNDRSERRNLLVEEHLISPAFAQDSHLYRMLVTGKDESLAVMINEEDHIRIQAICPGFNIDKAFEIANRADDVIIDGCDVAYDETLGFLTSCPTNLGTGMRASVMMHLPALTSFGHIKSLVNLMNKIGLCVRGIYGEGSEARGNLYQISNQVTLGIGEEDTVSKLKSAVSQIVERERQARKKLLEGNGTDTLWRSYGVLKYARSIDTNEASKLISNVLLAGRSGVIPECKNKNLIKLLFEIMPSHIAARFPDAVNASLRDKYRADVIRQYLSEEL